MGHAGCPIKFKNNNAQSVIEFTFAMILVLLLVYALMSIFRWNGVSLAERRIAHESVLIANVDPGFTATSREKGPEGQIDPYFYKSKKVQAVYGE